MREIKFKVKIKLNHVGDYNYKGKSRFIESKVHEVCSIGFKYPSLTIIDECGNSVVIQKEHCELCELMQFTGLKDKNGVEIYVGDIVNFHIFTQELGLNMGVQEGEKEFKGFICFEELGLAFKQSEEDEEWFYLVYSPGMIHEESFGVIGNIHESHELLK